MAGFCHAAAESTLTPAVSLLSGRGVQTIAPMRPAALLLPLLLAFAASALADDDDQQRAREALERGEVLALGEILAIVEARFGGHVIEIECEEDDGRYRYELELITRDGRLIEVEMDAATGAVLEGEYDDDLDEGDWDEGGWDD